MSNTKEAQKLADIEKRRADALCRANDDYYDRNKPCYLDNEKAENKKLRERLEKAEKAYDMMCLTSNMQAEREARLREALEKIAEWDLPTEFKLDYGERDYFRNVAKQALNQKGGSDV